MYLSALRLLQFLEKVTKLIRLLYLAQKINDKKHNICKKIIFKNFSNSFFNKFDEFEKPCEKISKKVFVFRYQDIRNAPDIVKICIESQRKFTPKDWELHIITKENLNQYIEIPACIKEKVLNKTISLTMFSDIVRFKLLYEYGGIWMDSTIFLSGNSFFKDISELDFYTIKGCFKNFELIHGGWTCFFIAANKGNIVCKFMYESFEKWFSNNNKPLTYLMVDCFMSLGYDNIRQIRSIIDDSKDIDLINSDNVFLLNDYYLSKSTNINDMETFLKKEDVHKLSYKSLYLLKSDSCYNFFKKNFC